MAFPAPRLAANFHCAANFHVAKMKYGVANL